MTPPLMSIGPALLTVVGEPLLSVSCVSCVFASTRVTRSSFSCVRHCQMLSVRRGGSFCAQIAFFQETQNWTVLSQISFLPCLLARFSETKSKHFMSPVCESSRGVAGVRCTQHRDLQAVRILLEGWWVPKRAVVPPLLPLPPSEQPASGRRPGGLN